MTFGDLRFHLTGKRSSDRVNRGQPLAVIDAPELEAQVAARANLAQLAAQQAYTTLRAPFAGVATTRSANVGTLVIADNPTATATTGANRTRLSTERPLSSGTAATYDEKTLGASLSWYINLFGSLRNRLRAGTANTRAATFDSEAIREALQSQLASIYFDLRGLDQRVMLLRDTVTSYAGAFALTGARHQGGIASGLGVGTPGRGFPAPNPS